MQAPDSIKTDPRGITDTAAAPLPSPAVPQAPTLDASGNRTSPDHDNPGWPPGVPYIVGNEACERFSYYGMNAILYVHLVSLYALAGAVEATAKAYATSTTHLFKAGVYALPMIGAILADRLLGKYQTILWLSLVYCAGHAVLSGVDAVLDPNAKLYIMYVGLGLIAVGSGGIKPCVSANVGDQFGKANWDKVTTIYQIFYFSINFGSFFSTLLIPYTKEAFGAGVAFAIPGILMFIATVIFWMGRKKYVHVPPSPGGAIGSLDAASSICFFMAVGHLFVSKLFVKQFDDWMLAAAGVAGLYWVILLVISAAFLAVGLWLFLVRQKMKADDGFLAIMVYTFGALFSGRSGPAPAKKEDDLGWFWRPAVARFGREATEGPIAVLKVLSVFFLISVFWALFDQHSSTWIRQAEDMNLTFITGGLLSAINSTFGTTWDGKLLPSQIPALNPLMVMVLIPLVNLAYVGFERAGYKLSALSRMTIGMFITALSFVSVAVLQGWIGDSGKGVVGIAWQLIPYFLITLGEVLVSITALEFAYTQAPKKMKSTIMGFFLLTVSLGNVLVAFLAGFEKLPLTDFFWIFAYLMGGAAVLFGLRAFFYVPKDYAQE